MALDSGRISLSSSFDARLPLRYGKFEINDFHAQKRVLSVPEIFTYSSNIGTARMALSLGVDYHKAFLKKLGQLDRLRTELPESAEPWCPSIGRAQHRDHCLRPWSVGGAAAGGDGHFRAGQWRQDDSADFPQTRPGGSRSPRATCDQAGNRRENRYLMRLNVEKGTATRANVPGYYVGGKTGTSDKVVGGRYSRPKS